uniref:Mobile element protein n=1 Tax=Hymenolepis diminuta TaxID=6216 RepID=A0A158QCH9_HYMDI
MNLFTNDLARRLEITCFKIRLVRERQILECQINLLNDKLEAPRIT